MATAVEREFSASLCSSCHFRNNPAVCSERYYQRRFNTAQAHVPPCGYCTWRHMKSAAPVSPSTAPRGPRTGNFMFPLCEAVPVWYDTSSADRPSCLSHGRRFHGFPPPPPRRGEVAENRSLEPDRDVWECIRGTSEVFGAREALCSTVLRRLLRSFRAAPRADFKNAFSSAEDEERWQMYCSERQA